MNRIKELRRERKLNQSQLAQVVKVRQTTVSNWENDVTEIDRQSLFTLTDYFGVTTDYILGKSERRDPTPGGPEEDLADGLEATVRELERGQDGIMFNGKALDDETRSILISSLRHAIEMGKAFIKTGKPTTAEIISELRRETS
jgi:transcriptional regulator with XRE-family HTH domain